MDTSEDDFMREIRMLRYAIYEQDAIIKDIKDEIEAVKRREDYVLKRLSDGRINILDLHNKVNILINGRDHKS